MAILSEITISSKQLAPYEWLLPCLVLHELRFPFLMQYDELLPRLKFQIIECERLFLYVDHNYECGNDAY